MNYEYINYLVFALAILLVIRRIVPTKGVKHITTAELKNELKDKTKQFIDVRTPREFKSNHIRGFKNIPLNQLPLNANQLAKEKEIVVICQSGMRSQQGCKTLKKLGFTKITNVKGGVSAWR